MCAKLNGRLWVCVGTIEKLTGYETGYLGFTGVECCRVAGISGISNQYHLVRTIGELGPTGRRLESGFPSSTELAK